MSHAVIDEDILKPLSRGFLKPLILSLLAKRELHGYRLMEELKSLLGRRPSPSFIYPALKELEDRGYIKGEWLHFKGRRIKAYSLTEAGRALWRRLKDYLNHLLNEF